MSQSILPICTSTFVLLITLALQSTCIQFHPNCVPFQGGGIPQEYDYMVALQNIIPSVQHIAQRYASETTGNWFDKDDVQNTYNNAAWPSGQNNIGPVQGLLQDVNSIDWTLQESRKPSKKRAMADYSITINCQPELMKSSLKKFEDYRVGLYFDSTLKVFVENTEAMNTCMNNDAPDTTPFILVQKGPSIPQPSYTIYICPAAKWLFKPQFAAYHFVQNTLLSATSATLWQEFQQKTNWNLGPSWSINNFVWLDSMILAALMAIGQGQDSAIIHGYTTDVWTHCFKTQGANWGDPTCLSLWTLTSWLAAYGILLNSDGYVSNGWNAPTLVKPPGTGSQPPSKRRRFNYRERPSYE